MKVKIIFNKVLWLIAAVFLTLYFCVGQAVVAVRAETKDGQYTHVLDDLAKDSTFDLSKYPAVSDDYSLQVIQIAESENKELFVYVYQPANNKDIIATDITIKLTSEGHPMIYPLKLVSTYNTLDKYVVEDLTVSEAALRTYFIISIYREYDESLGDKPVAGSTEGKQALAVGQRWWAMTSNTGETLYSMEYDDVVTVTSEYHGYIRYYDGYKWNEGNTFTDGHFVVFSVNRKIDTLKSAVVRYTTQDYVYKDYSNHDDKDGYISEGTPVTSYRRLQADGDGEDSVGGSDGDGWFSFGQKYTWKRIETLSSFSNVNEEFLFNTTIAQMQVVEEDAKKYGNQAWVLRYLETNYSKQSLIENQGTLMNPLNVPYTQIEGVKVTDVVILELTFITAGETYTVGVVDSMTSQDENPDGEYTAKDNLLEAVEDLFKNTTSFILGLIVIIAAIVLIAVLLPVVLPLLQSGLSLVIRLLKKVLNGIWSFIMLPFKLIGKLFKRNE